MDMKEYFWMLVVVTLLAVFLTMLVVIINTDREKHSAGEIAATSTSEVASTTEEVASTTTPVLTVDQLGTIHQRDLQVIVAVLVNAGIINVTPDGDIIINRVKIDAAGVQTIRVTQ